MSARTAGPRISTARHGFAAATTRSRHHGRPPSPSTAAYGAHGPSRRDAHAPSHLNTRTPSRLNGFLAPDRPPSSKPTESPTLQPDGTTRAPNPTAPPTLQTDGTATLQPDGTPALQPDGTTRSNPIQRPLQPDRPHASTPTEARAPSRRGRPSPIQASRFKRADSSGLRRVRSSIAEPPANRVRESATRWRAHAPGRRPTTSASRLACPRRGASAWPMTLDVPSEPR